MDDATRREWAVNPIGITPTGDVDRWALIVGISEYANPGLRLRFADRDAERLHKLLLTSSAGAFQDDHVLTLVNQDATLASLTKAMRTFLKKPAEEDLVLLFLACHGARDRDRPDDLYLLPHDTDPSDISGTALPMRELDYALRATLHSRRIVALVDACHSGGVGDRFVGVRAAGDDAAVLNDYLSRLSTSRGGVSLMTSAMANESSVEGPQWGGGHGVFTHFILEGLAGKADRPPYDGVVTIGELFDYVADRVKDATDGAQHPHISAGADRDLVLAVTGSLSADQHLELAQRLSSAAELLGEPTCWRGVAVQYGEAMRLRREGPDGSSRVQHALALHRSGDPRSAETVLRSARATSPEARRILGLLQLAQGRVDDARTTLLEPQPVEDWVPILFAPSVARGRRVALLIGLNTLDPEAYGGWDGRLVSPVNEVKALGTLLAEEFGFEEQIHLVDGMATAGAIQRTLNELVADSASCEALVVALSGHGAQVPVSDEPGQQVDTTFVAYDGQIRSADIDALLRSSAAARTTLIVSTAYAGRFARRGRVGRYDVLAACDEDEYDVDGPKFGVFFEALLPNLRPTANGAEVVDATRKAMRKKQVPQHPQFAVDGDRPLFVGTTTGSTGSGSTPLAEVCLGVTAAAGRETLDRITDLIRRGEVPATAAKPIALEWWRRGEAANTAALPISALLDASGVLAVAAAASRVRTDLPLTDAVELLATRPTVASDPELSAVINKVKSAGGSAGGTAARIRAVLVGLTALADGTAGLRTASDGVAAVKSALLAAGTPERQIATLLDEAATADAVRAALERARDGDEHPVLVYWAGPGALTGLVCFRGDTVGQTEIAALAGPHLTLVAEGINVGVAKEAPVDSSARPRLALLAPRDPARARPAATVRRPRLDGKRGSARYGPLTIALVDVLSRPGELADVRASAFTTTAGRPTQLAVPGRDLLISDPIVAQVDEIVRRVHEAELRETASRLRTLVEQRNGIDPEAQLQLGILLDRAGDVDGSLAALERSVTQFAGDPGGAARARLQLGRVLLASGRDRARAVSECRLATRGDPDLVEAWFWLGRAIAELVQRETATQASEALRTYLSRGAPIGRRAEVVGLLAAMTGSRTSVPSEGASA